MKNEKKQVFGKSSKFYLNLKSDFFENNDELLQKTADIDIMYSQQPIRKRCKICQENLYDEVDFRSHGIDYKKCYSCDHINGCFEDTVEFVNSLYINDEGTNYSHSYVDKKFVERVDHIYNPKVQFLIDHYPENTLSVLDIGCGAGHLVYDCIQRKILAEGIDVNKTLIEFGNNQINLKFGQRPLILVTELDILELTKNTSKKVISAIGLIEHLREPLKFFDAFKESSAKYLFFSVPMYSMSVMFEIIFQDIFPRHLSNGHTHLFSEKSIKYMYQLCNSIPIAEWRFGTDFLDLYRSMEIKHKMLNTSKPIIDDLKKGMYDIIDNLQIQLDQNFFTSQIHSLVVKK